MFLIWSLSLEISLIKKNEGLTWPELLVGDKQGELLRDPAQCAEIAERLMHLTSDELVSDYSSKALSQNPQVSYVKIMARQALVRLS